MTSPLTLAARICAGEWDGHKPSQFDWQALLVFRSGNVRLYQFSIRTYDLPRVVKRAHDEAKWDRAVAFLIRDTAGQVVHIGPVTDALGNPLEPRWRDIIEGRKLAA